MPGSQLSFSLTPMPVPLSPLRDHAPRALAALKFGFPCKVSLRHANKIIAIEVWLFLVPQLPPNGGVVGDVWVLPQGRGHSWQKASFCHLCDTQTGPFCGLEVLKHIHWWPGPKTCPGAGTNEQRSGHKNNHILSP